MSLLPGPYTLPASPHAAKQPSCGSGQARPPRRVAILGAESTGKTSLAQALAQSIARMAPGLINPPSVQRVNEALRAGCKREGRSLQAHQQRATAQAQAEAQAQADWVIADTPPLLTAVYSHLLFDDTRLYPMALAHHALYEHTLLTGLDLPWVADRLQRNGPHTRVPIDTLLRQALDNAHLPYRVVYGHGPQRLSNALMALGLSQANAEDHISRNQAQFGINKGRNTWQCNDCSDPDCERKMFTGLLQP